MKRIGLIIFLLISSLACSTTQSIQEVTPPRNARDLLMACINAGGRMRKVVECDGSESEWCVISEQEYCYADQVKDGKCSVGEFSIQDGGVIGIEPRVVCDAEKK